MSDRVRFLGVKTDYWEDITPVSPEEFMSHDPVRADPDRQISEGFWLPGGGYQPSLWEDPDSPGDPR